MLTLLPIPLALLALLASTVRAASIVLNVQPSTLIPNPHTLPPSTHATITSSNGAIVRSFLRTDNTIIFPEIPSAGSHLLNIYTKDYVFASYRIETTPNPASAVHADDSTSSMEISFAAQLFPGTQWSDTGLSLLPQQPDSSSPTGMSVRPTSSLTIVPKVLTMKSFYEDRPAFSPLSLLKNPMILLGIVALAFTFGMPKLMESMDPETKAEYEEMQKKGPTAAIGRVMSGQGPVSSGAEGFNLAGYLAGQKTEPSGNGADGIRGK